MEIFRRRCDIALILAPANRHPDAQNKTLASGVHAWVDIGRQDGRMLLLGPDSLLPRNGA